MLLRPHAGRLRVACNAQGFVKEDDRAQVGFFDVACSVQALVKLALSPHDVRLALASSVQVLVSEADRLQVGFLVLASSVQAFVRLAERAHDARLAVASRVHVTVPPPALCWLPSVMLPLDQPWMMA